MALYVYLAPFLLIGIGYLLGRIFGLMLDEPIWPWQRLRRERDHAREQVVLLMKQIHEGSTLIEYLTHENDTLFARLHQLESELGYAKSRRSRTSAGPANGRGATKPVEKTLKQTL